MAEGEEPPSEQAGGASPLPGLGVPQLGVPSTGSPGDPATSPLGKGQPEIVEDYYPYLDPRGQQQPPPKRRGFRLTGARLVLLVFIVLGVSGAIVSQVRHARATPADKAACTSTLGALANPSATGTMSAMLHDLEFANDKTLLGARGDMTTHIEQRDLNGLGNDLNAVVHRCNQISSDFKSGFQTFCDTHPGYCKQTFHIGPF
ncbi:MAG TPA: hypothetical protein VKV69_06550 [Actinomycetota bacterium]|nr:hypothetical protein [Actinomycetota bacterium]